MGREKFSGLLIELKAALSSMQLSAASEIAARMQRSVCVAPEDVSLGDISAALKQLRAKRLFGPLEATAEAYFQYAQPASVRYQYAQALVDQDQVTAALCMVEALLVGNELPGPLAEEVRGLRARAYKQAFVRAADAAAHQQAPLPQHAKEALRLSIDAYQHAYNLARDDPHWPKANLIALLLRAQREQVQLDSKLDAKTLARELLRAIEQLEPDPVAACNAPWHLASALEATLALGDADLTLQWGKRYLACRAADAFEFGSTLRQFTEVWQLHTRDLDRDSIATELLALLEATVLACRGGLVDGALGTRALKQAGLEPQAIWGTERFQSYSWMRSAVRCGDAIARIQDPMEHGRGTGFLVRGRELYAAWGEELLLLTNRHVVDDPPGPKGLAPARAYAMFTTLAGEPCEVAQMRWRSAPEDPQLDVAVLRLKDIPANAYSLLSGDAGNLEPARDPPMRIYVIGHPNASHQVDYSMYGNEYLGGDPPYLRYRSPTLDGSSGSPLFDRDWRLVGIHHSNEKQSDPNAGQGANVGSSINAIRAAIAANPTLR